MSQTDLRVTEPDDKNLDGIAEAIVKIMASGKSTSAEQLTIQSALNAFVAVSNNQSMPAYYHDEKRRC